MKLNIARSVKTVKNVVTANSPVLLVGTAVVGIVSTAILAAKGGYDARGKVEEQKFRRASEAVDDDATAADLEREYGSDRHNLSLQEKAQLTWLCYAIPAATATGTIAATMGSHLIHTKRHAATAAVYAITSQKLDDVTEKAEELLGTKKTKELHDSVAQKQIDRDASNFVNNEVIITGRGKELFHEQWGGRYLETSLLDIEKAGQSLNDILRAGDCNVNEFYDLIGLEPTTIGMKCGWNEGTTVELKWGSVLAPDGRSAVSVWFHPAPEEYGRTYR